MGSAEDYARVEVTRARPGLVHVLGNRRSGDIKPEALLELADAYLRLNPDDTEIRKLRDRLRNGTEGSADLRGLS